MGLEDSFFGNEDGGFSDFDGGNKGFPEISPTAARLIESLGIPETSLEGEELDQLRKYTRPARSGSGKVNTRNGGAQSGQITESGAHQSQTIGDSAELDDLMVLLAELDIPEPGLEGEELDLLKEVTQDAGFIYKLMTRSGIATNLSEKELAMRLKYRLLKYEHTLRVWEVHDIYDSIQELCADKCQPSTVITQIRDELKVLLQKARSVNVVDAVIGSDHLNSDGGFTGLKDPGIVYIVRKLRELYTSGVPMKEEMYKSSYPRVYGLFEYISNTGQPKASTGKGRKRATKSISLSGEEWVKLRALVRRVFKDPDIDPHIKEEIRGIVQEINDVDGRAKMPVLTTASKGARRSYLKWGDTGLEDVYVPQSLPEDLMEGMFFEIAPMLLKLADLFNIRVVSDEVSDKYPREGGSRLSDNAAMGDLVMFILSQPHGYENIEDIVYDFVISIYTEMLSVFDVLYGEEPFKKSVITDKDGRSITIRKLLCMVYRGSEPIVTVSGLDAVEGIRKQVEGSVCAQSNNKGKRLDTVIRRAVSEGWEGRSWSFAEKDVTIDDVVNGIKSLLVSLRDDFAGKVLNKASFMLDPYYGKDNSQGGACFYRTLERNLVQLKTLASQVEFTTRNETESGSQ